MFLRGSRFRRLRRLEVLLRNWGPLWLQPDHYRFQMGRLWLLSPFFVGIVLLQFGSRNGWYGLSALDQWGWPYRLFDPLNSSFDALSFTTNMAILGVWAVLASISAGVIYVRKYQPLPFMELRLIVVCTSILVPMFIILFWFMMDPKAIYSNVFVFSFFHGLFAVVCSVDKSLSRSIRPVDDTGTERVVQVYESLAGDPANPYRAPGYIREERKDDFSI